ncbi:non-heme iron oxygenase ferredoxin subunit [Photobacterium sagamiensis]|uniref:Rieske (2Fe-2S) protein n=1 Tax=Photobacterium sagamiensis TaxID=2910241 RepID=UPI003D0BA743
MTTWMNAIAVNELPAGESTIVELGNTELLLVNADGHFYAVENVCSHDGEALAGGEIDGEEIICPRHGARFCLKTGQVLCAPAYEDIKTYPVRITGNRVQVSVECDRD